MEGVNPNSIVTAGGAITALVAALIYVVKIYRADVRELIDRFESDAEKSREFMSSEMAKRDAVLGKMAVAVDALSERVDRLDGAKPRPIHAK